MKPQKKCQIKICLETPENREEKTGFYFFAPKEIAEQMKEFGILLRMSSGEFWEFILDRRYDYEEVKTYLLSLEPLTEGETRLEPGVKKIYRNKS